MAYVYVAMGLVILLLAGDALVKGAINMSVRLGVPALIVSLTIVALGTSAPEALVSVDAVLRGAPGIAIGNVVGSNTANILLVLGVPALLVGLPISAHDTKLSYLHVLLGTALFVGLAVFAPINWIGGLLLVGLFASLMTYSVLKALRARPDASAEVEGLDAAMRWRTIILYILMGLIGLPIGAELLVNNAATIARAFNISDAVIGLTLVAVGTSLPELATTVSAAFRKQADVALGNVLGSNMANILAIVGLSTFFGPIPIPSEMLRYDVMVMVCATLVLAPFVLFRLDLNRAWGALLTGAYLIYVFTVLA